MSERYKRLIGLLKLTSLALFLFVVVWALLAAMGIAAHSIAIPAWLQHVFLLTAIVLPFATSWQAIRMLKKTVEFGTEYPENVVGGMAFGLALSLPMTFALLSTAEFVKPPAADFGFLAKSLFPALALMGALGVGAALIRKNICGVLLVCSPLAWAVMFLAAAMMPQPPAPKRYGPMTPTRFRAKVLTIRSGPRQGRRAPEEEVLKMEAERQGGSN